MKNIFKKFLIYILRLESKLVLKKYKPKIVAITGSVGKTSTKDAIYAVLSTMFYVRKTHKSYNSEIGLPLTILGISNGWNNPLIWVKNILHGLWLIIFPCKYPEWLVLEVGISKAGDMKKVVSFLKTDAVVMTAIGKTPAHIEFFPSRKDLIEEKAMLIKTLKPDGVLVLNSDDEDILKMKNKTKNIFITYGLADGADLLASSVNIFYDKDIPQGLIFRVDENSRSLPVFIDGVFGINYVYSSLAALALASIFKLNMLEAIGNLKNYDVSPGRMRLLAGIKETLIIDDTYNSSPSACVSALKTLGEIKNTKGRKVAILGDMLELGRHTEEAHRDIGQIVNLYAEYLVVVGSRALSIKDGAMSQGMKEENIFEFKDSNKAGHFVKDFVQNADIILVKGSQGVRMEKIVGEIMLDKKYKNKLLVRQEKEWLEKV